MPAPPPEFLPPEFYPYRRTNSNAQLSVMLGVLGIIFIPLVFGPLSLILGFVAYRQILEEPYRYEGKNLAVGGMVLGAVNLIVAVTLLMFALIMFTGGGLVP